MSTFACWLIALLAVSPAMPSTAPSHTGLQHNVVFTAYPRFADNAELLRRVVSPLNAYRIKQGFAARSATLESEPLDPRQQRFALYVPPGPAPANGYTLLVFVPPWNDALVPVQWIQVLDRTRTIFVTAARSGNDTDVLNRREPLALLAAYGTMQRHHIDPAHVYVGGFSGGSRVALRLALAYPDVFRGALLDAGSNPIGTAQVPLPPADLLHRFQRSTRIVFVTGDDDVIRQAQLARASESLKRWCVFDTASITLLHTGHTLADAAGFARAMNALSHPRAPDARAFASCNAGIDRALDAALKAAHSELEAGRFRKARRSIEAIDARYGGLAAPRSVELLQALERAPHH
ncbi:MAG: hypothetical protein ACREP2_08765 [Rhodanobacteraceae bacterium]